MSVLPSTATRRTVPQVEVRSGIGTGTVILLLLVVLFVPVRRFSFGGGFPIEPELYRVAILAVGGILVITLLAGGVLPFRMTGLEAPLVLVLAATLVSYLANPSRAVEYGPEVLGTLFTTLGIIFVMYLVAGVVRDYDGVIRTLKVLVVGSAVLGGFAIAESRIGVNLFSSMVRLFPGASLTVDDLSTRGGSFRAQASSQHPIALGAMFAMLVPFGVVFAVHRGRKWLIPVLFLLIGLIAANSRTAVIMILITCGGLVISRWRELKPLLPWVVVLLALTHLLMPGALGSLRNSFFPSGGLVSEQRASAGQRGSGRVADLRPALHEFVLRPAFGYGVGTAVVVVGPRNNSPIYDDQWLGSLLDSGALGVFALIWFFGRSARRLRRAARRLDGEPAALLTALALAVFSFMAGMFFFDAFAFLQVTMIAYVLMALGSSLLLDPWLQPEGARDGVSEPGTAAASR